MDLICFDAARESLEAMARGAADICFLAIEPARAAEVAFTAPYVVIEGVFVVPDDSGITALADVDREHVRIGVNEGSAYDLFLSRTLRRASVVRGQDGIGVFREQGLEAGAGISQVIGDFVTRNPGFRMIGERFMQIRQAVGTTRTRAPGTVRFLAAAVEDLKASGFIRDALRRSGQDSALAASPEPPELRSRQPSRRPAPPAWECPTATTGKAACLLLGCAERTALAPGGPGGARLRPGGWRTAPGLRLAAALSRSGGGTVRPD